MNGAPQHLDRPVTEFIRQDFAQLREAMTAREALEAVRREGIGEKIVYFYVLDEERRLVGVLPTRRLLTAALDQRIGDLMIKRVIAIPKTATLLEACEFFVLHKFFAFPVADRERRILGLTCVAAVKIAAGPLKLALADILTLLFYLSIARLLLSPA